MEKYGIVLWNYSKRRFITKVTIKVTKLHNPLVNTAYLIKSLV